MADNTYQYITEIQNMMFSYGDYKAHLLESAETIEGIVLQQMQSLLVQVSEFAEMRGKNEIGHEDILFLMRKNRVKIRRLLKYMEFKDFKHSIYSTVNTEVLTDEVNPELDADIKSKRHPNSKVYRCIEFLKSIDQTGALYRVLEDEDIFDEEKHARMLRQNEISLNLDRFDYMMYEEARRQSSFACKGKAKFEAWIYQGSCVKFKPTKLALEMIIYLAQETVAKIIDLCLIAKEQRTKAILAERYSTLLHKGNSAAPQHNSRFVLKHMTYKNISEEMNLKCITPNDIWEVLQYFYQPKYLQFGPSTCSVMDKRLFCC